MANKQLNIIFAGDSSQLSQAFNKLSGDAGSMGNKFDAIGGKMSNFGKKMTVGVSSPIAALGGVSFKAASDLNESMSKVDQVFGTSAKEVQAWSKTTASSIGLSRNEALGAVGTFGNMFNQLGIGAQESKKMSTSMVTLAADFASFHNADITEVINAQSAAFRGEYDALQRFLPLINAASVEQKAMAMTGKDNARELTAQEKALAVNALMMEGAGKAAGDFGRTAEGAANKQRILKAELQDAAANIGNQLLPVGQRLLAFLSDLTTKFTNLSPQTQNFIIKAAAITAAVGPVLFVGGKLVTAIDDIGRAFMGMSRLLMANPFLALAAAAIAITFLIVQNWDRIKSSTQGLRDSVAHTFNRIGDAISAPIQRAREHASRAIGAIKGFLEGLWNKVRDIVDRIKKKWEEAPWHRSSPSPLEMDAIKTVQGINKAFGQIQDPSFDMGINGRANLSPGAMAAANGSAGNNITIVVEGSVISEGQLMDKIQSLLLQKQARGAALGF